VVIVDDEKERENGKDENREGAEMSVG
jgi:hypothetical protein